MIVDVVAMRGRDPENPSDRSAGNPNLEQRLEVNQSKKSNTITTVYKDNLLLETRKVRHVDDWVWEIDGELYEIRLRKLTPRECFRLMGFTDKQFEKAQRVNSNTQLYKQAGNSIVVNVLEAIFRNLNIKGVDRWKDKSDWYEQMNIFDYVKG